MSSSSASSVPPHLSQTLATPRSSRHESPTSSPKQVASPGSPRQRSGTIDSNELVRNNGGDARRALETVVAERNQLQAQNAQLWKLIERQRAQCTQLAADNHRLRADRDRANARLGSAGLEPVAAVRRVPHSSSAIGLGLRADGAPQIRRHNSDQDTSAATDVTGLASPTASLSLLSAAEGGSTGLLPSPLLDKKIRHESRMTFLPEVATFMSLADSPRETSGAGSSMTASASTTTMSSVSMYSQSPGDAPARQSQDTVVPRQSIDDGLASPTLPRPRARLSPASLPHTRLAIPSSTVTQNPVGRDVLSFVVAVTVRLPDGGASTWTVGKMPSAFVDLDTRLQSRSGKKTKEWRKLVAPLPEAKAWRDFAPNKVDLRKAALEQYLQSLLVAPLSDKTDLCQFLATDEILTPGGRGRKEGYLTKKGKNFGGWKARYFVAAGPVLEYYESRGGAHLGSIVIAGAQIGRQNRTGGDAADEREFRHAFLIIESKRGVTNRHVLCAESDAERDIWIEALVHHVDAAPLPPAAAPSADASSIAICNASADATDAGGPLQRKRSVGRKLSKSVVAVATQPLAMLQTASTRPNDVDNVQQPSNLPGEPSFQSARQLTSPTSKTFPSSIEDTTLRPNKRQNAAVAAAGVSGAAPGRQSYTPAYLSSLSNNGLSAPPGYTHDRERERKAKSGRFWAFGRSANADSKPARPVFGVALTDSIAVSAIAQLPAIVFRCIEYLEAKGADKEEGIYRLSGSSAVIKGLKDRFDAEGDVNLLALDNRWDPHAIAGLLKTFLRELPSSLLTRELHLRFLAVMDLVDSADRVAELARLVADLPAPNYALLRALTAHLIQIVRNAETNKMTLRNIGIVFSPTLGIPAGIFSELVVNFRRIFDDDDDESVSPDVTAPVATVSNKRNSMLYQAGGADVLLGLVGRTLDTAAEDSASASELSMGDDDDDDGDSETLSTPAREHAMSL